MESRVGYGVRFSHLVLKFELPTGVPLTGVPNRDKIFFGCIAKDYKSQSCIDV